MILKEIKSFFQYQKEGDLELLKEVLKEVRYKDGYVILREEKIKVENKEDAVGVFLANIPYAILGEGEIREDLPDKVRKIQSDAIKLVTLGINEVATLEIYLMLEMSLRTLYSEYLSKGVTIKYKEKKVKVKGLDYRRLKLYIRRKGWSKYKVKVNGEVFPFSQGSLLAWAERYMDQKLSLTYRLSVNVRNLLAHGEVEWDLFPTLSSVKSASYASWSLFDNFRKKYE
ncbi:hypothetical protein KN1_22890 [Stygiolobus caldivivus]|uniref:Uncharacterized protein n=2 Tax=Stygiolobus caldivivus TaxID=2824673 RepID=A0A8D5U878_9CREN|nr:hypothetical protein KN1_22890 [Stygiolobus caldivivus]